MYSTNSLTISRFSDLYPTCKSENNLFFHTSDQSASYSCQCYNQSMGPYAANIFRFYSRFCDDRKPYTKRACIYVPCDKCNFLQFHSDFSVLNKLIFVLCRSAFIELMNTFGATKISNPELVCKLFFEAASTQR